MLSSMSLLGNVEKVNACWFSGEWLLASTQVTPVGVSPNCMLHRGIASFSQEPTWSKYCKGLKATGVSKKQSCLLASEITSGVAVVVGLASRTELLWQQVQPYVLSPHISFLCCCLALATLVWHWQVEHIPALGREAQEDPQSHEILAWAMPGLSPLPGVAVGLCRDFSILAERAAQKTPLNSRVWLAEGSFPFGAGDHLQSLSVVRQEIWSWDQDLY